MSPWHLFWLIPALMVGTALVLIAAISLGILAVAELVRLYDRVTRGEP